MYTCTYYMRGTLWKSERCISEYVCQRDCKHVCTHIQTHPYILVCTDTTTGIHQHKCTPCATAACGMLSSESVSIRAMRVCASLTTQTAN